MNVNKKNILHITQKYRSHKPLTPNEIATLLEFNPVEKEKKLYSMLKEGAFPLALLCGFLFVLFSDFFDQKIVSSLPSWTNMSPELLAGVDYLWDFLGEPIGKENILYHLPNVILYTFGFFGIKKIIESVERKTWLESVLSTQELLKKDIEGGVLQLAMKKNHSLLFVGKGDFVAEQFVIDHPEDEVVTISENKPAYTSIWNCYDLCTLYDDLKRVLYLSDASSAGEYLFFPVQDNHLFLPNEHAYDLAPHKLDILIQNIRTIEKQEGWQKNRIIIVGDSSHQSYVQTVDSKQTIKGTQETISLESIAKQHDATILVDPTVLVLKKILKMAKGRNIVFRATKEGITEYKDRFYQRLTDLGYKPNKNTEMLTIGYDVFEDLTEQQALKKNKNYVPVILSKQVKDAVERNGYKKGEYLYVPELVLDELKRVTG